jgi:hypothetical protein
MSYDAVDAFFMKPFKFKHRGMTLTARPMSPSETISEKSLQALTDYGPIRPEDFSKVKWTPSSCVGEKVADHPDRVYIVVLSSYYQGESQCVGYYPTYYQGESQCVE